MLVGALDCGLEYPINALVVHDGGGNILRTGPRIGPITPAIVVVRGGGVVTQEPFPRQPNGKQRNDLVVVTTIEPSLPAKVRAPRCPTVDRQQQRGQVCLLAILGNRQCIQHHVDGCGRLSWQHRDSVPRPPCAVLPFDAVRCRQLPAPARKQIDTLIGMP